MHRTKVISTLRDSTIFDNVIVRTGDSWSVIGVHDDSTWAAVDAAADDGDFRVEINATGLTSSNTVSEDRLKYQIDKSLTILANELGIDRDAKPPGTGERGHSDTDNATGQSSDCADPVITVARSELPIDDPQPGEYFEIDGDVAIVEETIGGRARVNYSVTAHGADARTDTISTGKLSAANPEPGDFVTVDDERAVVEETIGGRVRLNFSVDS